jgi:hypothetical protein
MYMYMIYIYVWRGPQLLCAQQLCAEIHAVVRYKRNWFVSGPGWEMSENMALLALSQAHRISSQTHGLLNPRLIDFCITQLALDLVRCAVSLSLFYSRHRSEKALAPRVE